MGQVGRALLVAVAVLFSTGTVRAQSTISSSITYDGSISPFGYSQSSGILVIDGSGSPVLTLTNSATTSGITGLYLGTNSGNAGAIGVYGGSTLSTSGTLQTDYLGYTAGSMGTVTVGGAGSQWITSNEIDVGYSGTGVLNIANGGTVQINGGSTNAVLGANTGSHGAATVSGANSAWTVGGVIYVGNYGNGALTISSQGTVASQQGYVGQNAGSSGSLLLTGSGSTLDVEQRFRWWAVGWRNCDGRKRRQVVQPGRLCRRQCRQRRRDERHG
ncbi:MAG TPA: hypothetical protein VHZ24_13875 [Pirellulales bacterium]|jgi:T5SS/PEP-CTERM-associated repeat protein|nr:hypothetical protein [Pirellulales bacterium]